MAKTSYDDGFELAIKYLAAQAAAEDAETEEARASWTREATRLGNLITPAARQAAAPLRGHITREARKWYQAHGGQINVSDFIVHLRTSGLDARFYNSKDKSSSISDSGIRKIVASGAGIRGKSGRPPKK